MAMTRTSTETDSSKVYQKPVHSATPADDSPIMDSSSNSKTILLPRQDKPPSKVISPQSQQQLQNDIRPHAFLHTQTPPSSPVEHFGVKRNTSKVGKALLTPSKNSPKKVLLSKQKVLQPNPDDSPRVKGFKNVLVSSDASSNGLDDHLEEHNVRVFDGGDGSMPVEELAMSVVDVEMVEDSRVEVNKDKGLPVSHTVHGKVVYGNMEAMSDLLSKHITEEDTEEETGIFLSRAYWFLHSDEKQEVLRKKVLGRGSYGVVELYHHRQTEFVKKLVNEKFQVNEVLITATLDNPYIIKTFGLTYRLKKKTILMENWGKSLLQYSRTRRFPEVELWDLMFQGISGLEYLDQFGIRHHDMKPENILLKENGSKFLLKIADFGAAKWSTELNDMEGWTPEYLSPERAWYLLLKKFQSKLQVTGNEEASITGKSDVYSFALTMCFPYERCHIMLKYITDGKLFNEEKLNDAKVKMLIEVVANSQLAVTLIPSCVGLEMKQLLTRMLAGPVEERVTAGEARKFMYQLSEEAEARRQEEVDQVTASEEVQPVPVTTVQQTAVLVPSTSFQSPSTTFLHSVDPPQPTASTTVTLHLDPRQTTASATLHVDSRQPTASTALHVHPQQPPASTNLHVGPQQPPASTTVSLHPVVAVEHPQLSVNDILPSSSAVQQPEQMTVLSPAVSVDNLLTPVTPDVVQSPVVPTEQEQQSGAITYRIEQESAGNLAHLATQIQVCNLQNEAISLSKSLNPEERTLLLILPDMSKVVVPRLSDQSQQLIAVRRSSTEQNVVNVTDSTTSTLLSGDWKKMVNNIKMDNINDFSGGLKSRMIKRKLQNKLPEAKKQRLHEEPKTLTRKGRRGRKSVEPQENMLQNIPVESEQTTATGESTDKVGGNMPDLDMLF